MIVLQHESGEKGTFFIEQEGEIVAKMTYVWVGDDRIIIDHTEVDSELKGLGAGKQMVAKAVEFAREKGIKIVPLCPFVKSVINKVTEYHSVL
jgi:uncharacterized protein